jgi:hypothetical protein
VVRFFIGVLSNLEADRSIEPTTWISPGRRVENLRDDGSVRTDYYTEEQLKLLVSIAAETRGAHPLNFNDWPEFIGAGREYGSAVQGDALPRVF